MGKKTVWTNDKIDILIKLHAEADINRRGKKLNWKFAVEKLNKDFHKLGIEESKLRAVWSQLHKPLEGYCCASGCTNKVKDGCYLCDEHIRRDVNRVKKYREINGRKWKPRSKIK